MDVATSLLQRRLGITILLTTQPTMYHSSRCCQNRPSDRRRRSTKSTKVSRKNLCHFGFSRADPRSGLARDLVVLGSRDFAEAPLCLLYISVQKEHAFSQMCLLASKCPEHPTLPGMSTCEGQTARKGVCSAVKTPCFKDSRSTSRRGGNSENACFLTISVPFTGARFLRTRRATS